MWVIPHWFGVLSSWAWTLTNWPRLNLAHACLDIHGLKYMDINTVYSAPPSTLLPLLTKSKILQPEFQYACVLEELYHCQPWVNPMHCGLCYAEKICRLGVVYCDECYTCTTWGLLNPQPICNPTGESSTIHDCSVANMSQIKKMGGGEVEVQCLIKIGKRKKSVGLNIKLSERREHCLFLSL